MVKKRIVGVIIIESGMAVQSIGFNKYLPLGKPEILAQNLDRWGIDEIMVLSINRSKNRLGPDFELLCRLAEMRLTTPLVYGGGIRDFKDAQEVIRLGADRICIDSILHQTPEVIAEISKCIGSQALIASLPVKIVENQMVWVDYKSPFKMKGIDGCFNRLDHQYISEILLIDMANDGRFNSFNFEMLEKVNLKQGLIIFGGISDPFQIDRALEFDCISAVAIGNFLNYKEHALQAIMNRVKSRMVRDFKFSPMTFSDV